MNNIKDNPYRVLGVIANARMKEIQKNISRINSYLSIGKEITLLFDNDNFGSIIRNESTLNSAKKMLQLDSNKLEHVTTIIRNLLKYVPSKYLKYLPSCRG